MTVRVVEGKKPYTGGKAITVDENKVISLNLRDENNLIIYDAGDDEIYVDLQLPDEITPTDAFPVGVTTGRVVVDNGWDLAGTIICAKTTSGDNIKLLYADVGTLWIDNGTGSFKQIYFKSDVDALLSALRDYIDGELAKKQNGVVLDTAPENPLEGDLRYDTTSNSMKVYDGTNWNAVGTGGGSDIEYVTQAEYNALLPGALTDGKHYFIYTADSPTPPSPGWQPGANTLAYYPLDSVNTVNDLSGNNYNLTNNGNVTFGTVNGVDCATFGDSTPKGLVNTSANIISGQYTYLAWINMEMSNYGATDWARIFGGTNDWFILCGDLRNLPSVSMGPQHPPTNGVQMTAGWHLICFVGNTSDGSFTSYKDGEYVDSGTGATGSRNGIVIGAKENSYSSTGSDWYKGSMSKVIWENKQWTATEIFDYYNQTKGDYGIS